MDTRKKYESFIDAQRYAYFNIPPKLKWYQKLWRLIKKIALYKINIC